MMQYHNPVELWQAYADRLYRYIRRRVADRQTALDLQQEVFLKVHTYLQEKQDIRNPAAWLYQIAWHSIADYYRRASRHIGMETAAEPAVWPDQSGSPRQEAARCLRPLLKGLPDKYAHPLTWADLEGLSQQEVADRLGISLSGAKSRIQRGRAQLRALMLRCCRIEQNARGQILDFVPRDDCDLFAEGC